MVGLYAGLNLTYAIGHLVLLGKRRMEDLAIVCTESTITDEEKGNYLEQCIIRTQP